MSKTTPSPLMAEINEVTSEFVKTPTSTAPQAPDPTTPATPEQGITTPETVPADPPAATPQPSGLNVPEALLKRTKPAEGGVENSAAPASSKEENLANMRKRIEDQQRVIEELNALKAKYLDPNGNFMLPEEHRKALEERDKQIKELSEELGKENLVKSPEFKKTYLTPINEKFAEIQDVFKQFDVDPAVAERLVAMPLKERYRAMNQIAGEAAPILLPMFGQLDSMLRNRDTALADHQRISQELKTESTTIKQQKIAQLQSSLRDEALSRLESEGHFIFSEIPGEDAWNTQVKTVKNAVNTLIQSQDPKLQVEALALGVAAPMYKQLYEQELARREQLEAEVTKRTRAIPGVGASGGQQNVSSGTQEFTPSGAANAVLEKLFR